MMSDKPFRLITVEQVLAREGKRLVVFPGILVRDLPHPVHVGDQLELRCADGTKTLTHLASIEHAKMMGGGSQWPLTLPETIRKEDVPIGTEVWWVLRGNPVSDV